MSPKEKDVEDIVQNDDNDKEHDVDQMMDDIESSKEKKAGGSSSEAFTMQEQYKPSLFTDQEGNLKYVNAVVRRPCCMFSVTILVTLLISFLHFAIISQGGNPFTEPTGQYDIKDKRSVAYDSVRLAKENVETQRTGVLLKMSGKSTVRTQEALNGVTLWIFESETEDGLFSSQKSISDMHNAITIFTSQKNYTQYCMKDYCDGAENTLSLQCLSAKEANNGTATPAGCILPLTAMNMYYASEWNTSMATSILDELKIEGNIERYNAVGLCIENKENPLYCESLTNTTYDTEDDKKWGIELNTKMTSMMNKWDGGRSDTPSVEEINQMTEFAAYMIELETKKGELDYFFDSDFSIDNQESKYSRATILWGSPLDVEFKEDEKKNEEEMTQEEKDDAERDRNGEAVKEYVVDNLLKDMKELAKDEKSDESNSYYFMPALLFEEFIAILQFDGLLALFSFAFVFVWIRICVGSWFLAFVGFLEIVLSIPISWFIYSSILQVKYFAGLNVLALYIVAAIGADDIFIFMDAYKQSAYLKDDEHPGVLKNLESRMSWVYRRTGSAMAITSATTCSAFLCTLITPIADVRSFGLFAAIVIFIDYVLVMTLFCTAVVVYHNKFEKPGCCCACDCSCRNTDPSPTEQALANDSSLDESKITAFFRDRVAGFISGRSNRLFLGVAFIAWIAVALSFGLQIKPVEKEEQALSEDHPLQKSITILNQGFSNAENDIGLMIHFAWGIDDVDRSGVRQLRDPEYLGKAKFDEGFEFNEQCQSELLNQCDALKQDKDLAPYIKQKGGVGSIKCFVEEFAAFSALGSLDDCDAVMEGKWRNSTWQVPTGQELSQKLLMFSVAKSCYSFEGEFIFQYYNDEFGFNGADLNYATIAVENPVLDPFTQKSESFVREQYDKMIEVSEELDASVRQACQSKQVLVTDLDQKFIFMHNQRIYVRSAVQSASVGIGIAFLVLMISTRVFHIASLATISIMGVLISVVGCLVMFGWDLGTTESILISIIAGFSVDYVVHLAHAYKAASGSTENRIQSAFGTMGISVLNGMITSVGASVPLFFCEIQFFLKFGTFLFLTIGFSWVFANFGFMSVLATLKIPITKGKKCSL